MVETDGRTPRKERVYRSFGEAATVAEIRGAVTAAHNGGRKVDVVFSLDRSGWPTLPLKLVHADECGCTTCERDRAREEAAHD